jgi:hypothetical protein
MDKETKMSLYKEALVRKLEKVKNRLKIIDRYVADEKSKELTLGQWLKIKGLDIREFFASIGYNSEYDRALSHDSENKFINSAKDVIFDKSKGHPIIKTEEKSGIDGMVFNEHTQRYYPINDTICYQENLANQKPILNDVEGINLNEIGDLDISNSTNKYKMYWLKEALGCEYDNLDGEYEQFEKIPEKKQKRKEDREKRINQRIIRIRLYGNPF